MYPADLWLQREGSSAWVIANGYRLRRPATEVLAAVESLGEAILDRLNACLESEPRAAAAMEAWRRRVHIDASSFVTLATNLPPDTVERLSRKLGLAATWGLRDPFRDSEILAAARMVGTALPVDAIRRVITGIRRLPRAATPGLDTLSRSAGEVLQTKSRDTPHDQGTAMATWARERLGVPPDRRLDPEKVLETWGVKVVEIDLRMASLDAIGCWGPDHGPAVFINVSGRHVRGRAGRRATMAHEIAHLLLDRNSTLPLAEVVGGRVPPVVEPRASAFAAELLVPRSVAAALADVPSKGLEREVRRLSTRYGASREIVSWQAWNSEVPFSDRHISILQGLVSEPGRMTRR